MQEMLLPHDFCTALRGCVLTMSQLVATCHHCYWLLGACAVSMEQASSPWLFPLQCCDGHSDSILLPDGLPHHTEHHGVSPSTHAEFAEQEETVVPVPHGTLPLVAPHHWCQKKDQSKPHGLEVSHPLTFASLMAAVGGREGVKLCSKAA